jgi:hypothetical protein
MLIKKHKSLLPDEAMAIAIERHEPDWLTRPRAEVQLKNKDAPFTMFAVPLIKQLCKKHSLLTYEEWFIIAKLYYFKEESDYNQ